MPNLYSYLRAIAENRPINYPVMLKMLSQDIQRDHHFIFRAAKIAVNRYEVKVLNEEVFEQLLAQYGQKPVDRIDAAMQGDSHQVSNDTSFFLTFHQHSEQQRPDVVVIDKHGVNQGFQSKQTVLVIENQTNFFHFNQLLSLFSLFYGKSLDLSCCDVIYGAGKQVNKALNLSFLGQYHSVVCAFDYDLAGLTMYRSLHRSLDAQVTFLQPDNYLNWQSKFVKTPVHKEIWLQAIELANELGFTALAKVMASRRAFMEQEVFLAAPE